MKLKLNIFPALLLVIVVCAACGKNNSSTPNPPPPATPFTLTDSRIGNAAANNGETYRGIPVSPDIIIRFSGKVSRTTASAIGFATAAGAAIPYAVTYSNSDSAIAIKPVSSLAYLAKYVITIPLAVKSTDGVPLTAGRSFSFFTRLDSTRKFPAITDDQLLTLVQQQTFKYFWDLAHPASGMIRERNSDANIYTSGGTGFGVMAIITGVNRNFITRAQGLTRVQTMVSFLKNTAEKFHGAFPHWLNGADGKAIPFSANDDGADLVETSYLLQGLLCARQYFNGADPAETSLRNDINAIWNGVEWDWFRKGGENVMYWHWSSKNANPWIMNLQIKGWNECLITYILAASSTTHAIPKIVYDNGWASNGGMKNNNTYFGYQLPLGPNLGGPLFFAHYSFLGINPNNLSDAYANYLTQNKNHTLINYNYCKANPRGYYGYSDSTWGLTASDIENGYNANSPTNDQSFISPTAALSSFPYTPAESMAALKFYYYVLGDKIWKDYGFVDAFSLHNPWFASSFLAIDQGPIIIMIENYRSSLLWNLFTSCPEIKTGMQTLGFSAPYL